MFDNRDSLSIQDYLLSADDILRKKVARELLTQVKLRQNISELGYLIHLLIPVTESKDLEVLDGATRCLSRFATEVWPAYEKYCYSKKAESVVLDLFNYKHQGIRSAAMQTLIATCLHTGNLKNSSVIWSHRSPKVHASGVLAVSACHRAGISINPLITTLLSLLSSNQRKVINVVISTLESWLDKAKISLLEKEEIELACDSLSGIDNIRIKELISSIRSKLETLVAGQKPKAAKYQNTEFNDADFKTSTVRVNLNDFIEPPYKKPPTQHRKPAKTQDQLDPRIGSLIAKLLDETLRNEWGWGQCYEPGWRTKPGPLTNDVVARLSCGSLKVAYFTLSSITVDLKKETVILFAADQKTPEDKEWVLFPTKNWWDQARAIPIWPVGERVF